MTNIRWPSLEERSVNPATQQLRDRTEELRILLHAFNSASWPYLGSGFALVDGSVRATDKLLEDLCQQLCRNRGASGVYANPMQIEPEGDWLGRLRTLSNGVARLPQVCALLNELRPKAERLREGCVGFLEHLPNAPLPILSAAKSVIVALDRWLDLEAVTSELKRLREECEGLAAVAEMMGTPEVASRARRAAEALLMTQQPTEFDREVRRQADQFTASRVRAIEAAAERT